MKKQFKTYLITWAVLFVIFNLICFLTPSEVDGMTIFKLASYLGQGGIEMVSKLGISDVVYNKYGGAFFAGYLMIVIGFAAQLVCTYFACKEENSQKFFYKLPLITISYTFLTISEVVGIACIIVPDLPLWAGVVLMAAVAVVEFIMLAKANAAAEIISEKDDEIKARTSLIKDITGEVKDLLDTATEENKKLIKPVYEEIRYSDPMSSVETEYLEKLIQEKFIEIKIRVKDNKAVKKECDELVALIKDRNTKCKASK